MKGAWTKEEFEETLRLLGMGLTPAQIGRSLGRSETAVRLKVIKAGYSSRVVDPGAAKPSSSSLEGDGSTPANPAPRSEPSAGGETFHSGVSLEAAHELLDMRDERTRNRRERAEAIEIAQRDRLLDIFREAVSGCLIDYRIHPPQRSAPQPTSAHAAVLLLGDLHVGKVCSEAETEGRAIYNPAHFVARLALLEREVLQLIEDGPAVDELVILFLGDVVEGHLDHGAEKEDNLLISHQFVLATHLLSQFLLRVASSVETVRVYGVGGNHARWPGQRRPPTVGRESNLDHLVYRGIEMIVEMADAKHIRFCLSEAPRQTLQVKTSTIALLHGDQIRGGDFYVNGIKREVFSSVLRHAPSGNMPDIWIAGDKHVPQSMSVGLGRWLINGSFVGEDTFGQNFSPASASQTLLWICPSKGKFLQAEIRLDGAVPSDPQPYHLSAKLTELISPFVRQNTIYENN